MHPKGKLIINKNVALFIRSDVDETCLFKPSLNILELKASIKIHICCIHITEEIALCQKMSHTVNPDKSNQLTLHCHNTINTFNVRWFNLFRFAVRFTRSQPLSVVCSISNALGPECISVNIMIATLISIQP